jgi:hypothetical protein
MERHVKESLALVAERRREGLAKIASRNRHIIDREDACGAYMEARRQLRQDREQLAAVHPEKNAHLSPAAKARHEVRHGNEVITIDGKFIGYIFKNATGNWVAMDPDGNRLTEKRPTLHGDREFAHFARRRDAIAALRKSRDSG